MFVPMVRKVVLELTDDMYYRYFIFSKTEFDEKSTLEKKAGNKYKAGKVWVNGFHKPFTSVVRDPSQLRYSDAQIVCKGDIRRIKYSEE